MTEPCVLSSSTSAVHAHLEPTVYPDGEREGQREVVKIYPFGSHLDPAFCIHQSCWEILRSKNVTATPECLFSLGLSTRPLYDPPSVVGPYADDSTFIEALHVLAPNLGSESTAASLEKANVSSSNLTLIDLLNEIRRRLPNELISRIWTFLQPCLARSLFSIIAAAPKRFLEKTAPLVAPQRGVFSVEGTITAYFIRMHGEDYLCGIRNNSTGQLCGYESKNSCHVSIQSPVIAVSFNVGLYGLRRLGFHSQGGSCAWIGAGRRKEGTENVGWTGILRSRTTNISCLEVQWDVRKPF